MNPQPWDAALLSRIAHIHLQARRAVAGWQAGVHRSVHHSSNIEFVDYTEYGPGDPIRHIDWRVAARSDKLVIRRHEAESRADVHIVLDASGDLGTGESAAKSEAAVMAAATLAVFVNAKADRVGLDVVGGSGVEHTRIRPGLRSLPAIMRSLAQVEPSGQADLAATFERLSRRIAPRSICIVISDLMEEPAEWRSSLALLSKRGVDVRILHIHDPAEWTLDFSGEVRLFSPEDDTELPLDLAAARAQMPAVVDGYLADIREALASAGVSHHRFAVDAPLHEALRTLLRGRA